MRHDIKGGFLPSNSPVGAKPASNMPPMARRKAVEAKNQLVYPLVASI